MSCPFRKCHHLAVVLSHINYSMAGYSQHLQKQPTRWPFFARFIPCALTLCPSSSMEKHFAEYTARWNINKAAKCILYRFTQVGKAYFSVYPQYISTHSFLTTVTLLPSPIFILASNSLELINLPPTSLSHATFRSTTFSSPCTSVPLVVRVLHDLLSFRWWAYITTFLPHDLFYPLVYLFRVGVRTLAFFWVYVATRVLL